MERDTFDRLVRLMSVAGTRRDAFRLAATAAFIGGSATLERAEAKRRRKRVKVHAEQIPSVCEFSAGLGCSHGPEPKRCTGTSFRPGANLTNCNYITESGFLVNVNLRGANLTGTCWFLEELLGRTTFSGANLSKACFAGAELAGADFRGTNVRGATFCEAILYGADFRGSNVTAAQLACAQVYCNTILPNGKPAVPCAAGQICCGGVCCAPENCVQGTCQVPGS